MVKFLWKKIYKVGIPELDLQHKEILNILNELSHSVYEGSAKLNNLFDKLIEHINYHFNSEEKYFVKCNYPLINNNLKEHKELRERILYLKNKFKIDKKIDINELSKLIKDLQVKHMMLSGKRFGFYLTKKTNSAVC